MASACREERCGRCSYRAAEGVCRHVSACPREPRAHARPPSRFIVALVISFVLTEGLVEFDQLLGLDTCSTEVLDESLSVARRR
jgi:hypothetical protein